MTIHSEFRVRDEDKARALAYYEGFSRDYNHTVARGPLKLLRDRERRAITELIELEDKTKKTMIDVGCGGGFYALLAKEAGLAVSAVDLSPGMVERLQGKVDAAWVSDVESLPKDKAYDIVVCSGVLDFVLDPETAFANLCGIVSPGGRLIVQAPHAGLFGWIYRVEKKFARISVNLYRYEWFRAQAEKHGLGLNGYRRPLPYNQVLRFERMSSLRAR